MSKNHILVLSKQLTTDCLLIQYRFDGKKKTIRTNPAGTCCLLKLSGFIESFSFNGGELMIIEKLTQRQVDQNGSLESSTIGHRVSSWKMFVERFIVDEEVAMALILKRHEPEAVEV